MKDATRNYSQDFMYIEISLLMHDPLCFPFLFLLQDNGVFQYLSTYCFLLINELMDADCDFRIFCLSFVCFL